MKIFQGTIRCCEHANNNNNSPPTILQLSQSHTLVDHACASVHHTSCLYSSPEFCNVLLECIKLNNIFYANSANAQPSIEANTNGIVNHELTQPQAAQMNSEKRSVMPTVSINVTDTENLSVCMCSLYASSDNVLIEQQESMVGAICPRCQNIIKQQPIEHRKTLISKRLTLAKDIIVNRVDTHFLSLKTALEYDKRFEPYTPESIESHSPQPEPDTVDSTDSERIEVNANIVDMADAFDMSNKRHARTISTHSGVSPRQLKSRLENLRKTSTDAGEAMINATSDVDHVTEMQKARSKNGYCLNGCCVIL